MTAGRRTVLKLGSMTLLMTASSPLGAASDVAKAEIAGFAFDAFTIFDPGRLARPASANFRDTAANWLRCGERVSSNIHGCEPWAVKYASFWVCTESALEFAARSLELRLPRPARVALMTE